MIPTKIIQVFLLLLNVVLLMSLRTTLAKSSALKTTNRIRCIDKERQALLNVKKGLIDDFDRLSSWGEEENNRECCKWTGVLCNNVTNHVVRLDLRADPLSDEDYSPLRGNISPSLTELSDLNYLDLSGNDLSYTRFPNFIGSLSELRYLNLSYANISGPISHHLGNLTKLQYLDLLYIGDYSYIHGDNLDWISPNLHSLEFLDLSFNNLSKATNWLQPLSTLPSIKELRLSSCDLPQIVDPSPSLLTSLNNASASLAILDLSRNHRIFSSSNGDQLMFNWFLNFSNTLTSIDLSADLNVKGSNIPDVFQNMASLTHLYLSYNMLEYVPKCFGNLSSLMHLDMYHNSLNGQLSDVMMILSGPLEKKLQNLDLGSNSLSGSLPNMSRFSSLTTLRLSGNRLNGTISDGFLQLSNLVCLDLSNNQITGQVPNLSFSTSLRVLYLYVNKFNGTLTDSIGRLSKLEVLFLSSNQLEGVVTEAHVANLSRLKWLGLSSNPMLSVAWNNSHFVPPFQLHYLKMGSCELGPQFPKWLRTQKELVYLDISNAQISDTISNLFDSLPPTLEYIDASDNQIYGFFPDISFSVFNSPKTSFLEYVDLEQGFTKLDLSNNKISGSIQSLCNWTRLNSIDLSYNLLSDHLPNCFASFEDLQYLNLANNNFHGEIPPSIGSLSSLSSLHLQNNNFSGEIPTSMRNCKNLVVLELQENKLTGEVPTWIGDNLSNIVALVLRSNTLYGTMPSNLCSLKHLQILDLSSNNILGEIPKCIHNMTAMITAEEEESRLMYDITRIYIPRFSSRYRDYILDQKPDSAYMIWKSEKAKMYSLGFLALIDLSSNNLTGEIPSRITELVSLLELNFSNNNLRGPIPRNIGELNLLNALDLSRNHLSGAIPTSISELGHLGALDLSYNNLSGRIPRNGHSLTFDDSTSYIGNLGLCGRPLNKSCAEDNESTLNNPDHDDGVHDEDEDAFISDGFYISMGLGIVFGFWGILATIILNKSFRYSFLKVVIK